VSIPVATLTAAAIITVPAAAIPRFAPRPMHTHFRLYGGAVPGPLPHGDYFFDPRRVDG
jgi:hypothetical protein